MKTPGQILYEIMGKRVNHAGEPAWRPWGSLSATRQALYEQMAAEFLSQLGAWHCGLSLADLKSLATHNDNLRRYAAADRGDAGA